MSKFKIALLPFAMFSAITANAAPMYIEVQLGTNNADVDTKTYTDTAGTIVVTDLKASYDYDSATSVGFELGTSINENFRVGASYSTMDLDFNSARITGSITDGVTTFTGPTTVTNSQFNSIGLSFDNEVDLYMAHAYYDFPLENGLTPYVGVAAGLADIENAKDEELALSLAVGAKYDLSDTVYIGAKAAYTEIDGPTDKLGLNYEDISVTSFNLNVGYKF